LRIKLLVRGPRGVTRLGYYIPKGGRVIAGTGGRGPGGGALHSFTDLVLAIGDIGQDDPGYSIKSVKNWQF
jgi:hypothetical protein